MESSVKKQPLFWINPNTRLSFSQFSIKWYRCEERELLAFCAIEQERRKTYHVNSLCIHLLYEEDFSLLHILYSDDVKFNNIRLQKWLRESIRDAVMERAKIVLPLRLHELEAKHHLWAKGVTVRKLRKGVLGQCYSDKQIVFSPIIVIFPQELMDIVILHEMAHLKYYHHRKTFWVFLSTLIGMDAREQNQIQDIVLSKYWELYVFLMK